MRHGGRLWAGSTLTSLSHSVHRYALAETRSGIGSDRSNRSAWSAPISPMGHPFPLSSWSLRGTPSLPSVGENPPPRRLAGVRRGPLTPGAPSWVTSRGRAGSDAPVPKIGAVLALVALILFGLAVFAVAAVLLLRSARAFEPREARYPGRRSRDPEQGEREVYEKLYGKRSATVSAPSPAEAPPEVGADSPQGHTPSANPRSRARRRSESRDSHR
jgi:hypothetical protein